MSEFINNLNSLYWWLSVVIIGILINLTSAYLKNKLDARVTTTSSWWRKRSQIRKETQLRELNKLRDDPHEYVLMAISSTRDYIKCVVFLIGGFALIFCIILSVSISLTNPPKSVRFLKIAQIFTLLCSAVCSSMSARYFISATLKEVLLSEAQSSKKMKK